MARNFSAAGTDKVALSVSLDAQSNSITIMVWAKLITATNSRKILANYNAVNGYLLGLGTLTDNNKVKFNVAVNSGSPTWLDTGYSTTALDDGSWHCVFAILESGSPNTAYIYVDDMDTAENSGTSSESYIAAGGNFTIGNRPANTNQFPGDIGEVAVWQGVVLNAGQRKNAKNRGPLRCGVQPDYYGTISGADSPEPDFSGNGLSGTVTGTTVVAHPPVSPAFGFDSGLPYEISAGVSFIGAPDPCVVPISYEL